MIYALLVLLVIWAIAVGFLRYYRVWLLYYLVGTIGMAFFLVQLGVKLFEVHTLLAQSVAASVHLISGLLNIPTEIFSEAPGILMVLVVVQRIGWTILEIGVESSGLLEISVLVSLVAFYPGWKPLPRLARMLIGAFLSWFANVLRLMVILFMLHYLGKQSLVLAHTFLGKTVFFFFTIAIYWFLITLPSLKMIENLIQQRREQNLTREPGGAP